VVEATAAGGFATLQSRLRHETAHRSTNISIIQTYKERDAFTESIIMSGHGWHSGLQDCRLQVLLVLSCVISKRRTPNDVSRTKARIEPSFPRAEHKHVLHARCKLTVPSTPIP